MPYRHARSAAIVALVCAGGIAHADDTTTHRNGFAGRNPYFVRGEANIRFDEKLHKISDEHARNAPTSEQIRIEANPPGGAEETEFVHYVYSIPPAPVSPRLNAGLWLKAYRAGAQLRARIVFPKERDPKNPDAPLTSLIVGDTYRNVRSWEPLNLGNVPELVRQHMPVLHAKLGRAVDPTDAYLDQLILNVYSGPGVTDLWVDDLSVGPVRAGVPATPAKAPELPARTLPEGTPAGRPGDRPPPQMRSVRFDDTMIKIDGDPFFMLAVRHSNTPLKTLRDANLNTVWFPPDASPETIDEAVRQGFWIVPQLPVPADGWDGERGPRMDEVAAEAEAAQLASHLRRFLAGDAVLMWNLGGGRTAEELGRVKRATDALDRVRLKQPRAVDLWDGFEQYSFYVDAVGTHRWPLFTSLELHRYKDWLAQRRALTSPKNLSWTWVQTHVPEWYVSLMTGREEVDQFDNPIGPHPEQIRILTYLSLAAGCRGLGYWSDEFLANTHHGRDRLLELAMLNTEIEMLKPVLFSASEPAKWLPTSDGNVQAALIRGSKEILVLPVWLGGGTQFTPPRAALPALTITVPLVPDAAIPWLVSPAGVTELKGWKRVAGGTRITIPEFDLTAAVVFTSDLQLDGKIVRWQDHTRYRVGELAAGWARQQAVEQFNKALTTHRRIVAAGGPELPEAGPLFATARVSIDRSQEFMANKQWDMAYREARRAQRPLRVLMRADWEQAVKPLDAPTASPYAVSFYSLPEHWELANRVAMTTPGESVLPHGRFELSREAPDDGAAISSLPGWSTRQSVLRSDPVIASAAVVNSNGLEDAVVPKPQIGSDRYAPIRVALQEADITPKPKPELGSHALRLRIEVRPRKDRAGRPLPDPQTLERAFLAVDSPTVDLPPGSLVRVSFWAKVPAGIQASADGAVVYDSAGGEPLSVRLDYTDGWRKFALYRTVPSSGKLAVTFALTGIGTAYFDDVRVEPLATTGSRTAISSASP